MGELLTRASTFSLTEALRPPASQWSALFGELAVVATVRLARRHRGKGPSLADRVVGALGYGVRSVRGGRPAKLPRPVRLFVAKVCRADDELPTFRTTVSLAWCRRFSAQLESARERLLRQGEWRTLLRKEHPLFADLYVDRLVGLWSAIRHEKGFSGLEPFAVYLATRRAPPGSGRLPRVLLTRSPSTRIAVLMRLREARSRTRRAELRAKRSRVRQGALLAEQVAQADELREALEVATLAPTQREVIVEELARLELPPEEAAHWRKLNTLNAQVLSGRAAN